MSLLSILGKCGGVEICLSNKISENLYQPFIVACNITGLCTSDNILHQLYIMTTMQMTDKKKLIMSYPSISYVTSVTSFKKNKLIDFFLKIM